MHFLSLQTPNAGKKVSTWAQMQKQQQFFYWIWKPCAAFSNSFFVPEFWEKSEMQCKFDICFWKVFMYLFADNHQVLVFFIQLLVTITTGEEMVSGTCFIVTVFFYSLLEIWPFFCHLAERKGMTNENNQWQSAWAKFPKMWRGEAYSCMKLH